MSNNTIKRVNKYGEVFTPPCLIHELLDHLPPSIWKNPNTTILDPCAGHGNFLSELLPRFMSGLSQKIRDPIARKRHILTNMITLIELNPTNIREIQANPNWPKSFLELGRNLIRGDFLDESIELPHKTYTVILANPPYQAPKDEEYKGSMGNHTLWDFFLKKAIQMADHIGFITPSNWRRPEHPLYQEIVPKLTFLRIYSKQDGIRLFDVQSRFDLYVLNTRRGTPTSPIPLLIDEDGKQYRSEIHPNKWPFLPNRNYQEIRPLLAKHGEQRLNVIFHSTLYDARKLKSHKTIKYKYPVVHTITKTGVGIRYADHRDPSQFGIPKVILNANEKQYPILDDTGKYGMSQLSFGIPIRSKKHGEQIIGFLNSPGFQEILEATKWGSFQTDYRMFKYFRRDFYCSKISITSKDGSGGATIEDPKLNGGMAGMIGAGGSTELSTDIIPTSTPAPPPVLVLVVHSRNSEETKPIIHFTKKYRSTKKNTTKRQKK